MTQVQDVLITAAIALIPVLTGFLIAFVKAKTADLKTKSMNDDIRDYIDIAERAIAMSVDAVGQVYVDALKKSGTFDADAQQKAFEMAKGKALTIMGESALNALEMLYEDTGAWIDAKIEQAVAWKQ